MEDKKSQLLGKTPTNTCLIITLIFYLISIVLMVGLAIYQYVTVFKNDNSEIDTKKLIFSFLDVINHQVVDEKHFILLGIKSKETSSLWFQSYINGFQSEGFCILIFLAVLVGSGIFVFIISLIKAIAQSLSSFSAYKRTGILTPFCILIFCANWFIAIAYDATDMDKKYSDDNVIDFYKSIFMVSLFLSIACFTGILLIYLCLGEHEAGLSNYIYKKIFLSSMLLFNLYYALYCMDMYIFLESLPTGSTIIEWKVNKYCNRIKLCSWLSITIFSIVATGLSWILSDLVIAAGTIFMDMGIIIISTGIKLNDTIQSILSTVKNAFEKLGLDLTGFLEQPDEVRKANIITASVFFGLVIILTIVLIIVKKSTLFK